MEQLSQKTIRIIISSVLFILILTISMGGIIWIGSIISNTNIEIERAKTHIADTELHTAEQMRADCIEQAIWQKRIDIIRAAELPTK